MPQHIKDKSEYDAVVAGAGDKLIVIDFFADWCGPCKMIAPKFEEFSKTYPNSIFLKVDVDSAGDVAEHFNIEAMPTFAFVKGGKEVTRIMGANKDALEKQIKDLQ